MAAENDGQDRSPQISPSRELYAPTFVPFARGAHISSVTATTSVVPFRTDAGDSKRRPDELPLGGTMSGTAGNASAQAPPGAGSSALALIVALALAAPYLLTTLELAVAQRRPLLLGPRFERPG